MFLNNLRPAIDSRPARKRLGRGIGSTLGKTSGKGHKGQKARAGGFHKVGFEGGQMPLQRRLPKVGFRSRTKKLKAEVRLDQLTHLSSNDITPELLKASKIVSITAKYICIIGSGSIDVAVTIHRIRCTQSAKDKIISAGGKVED
jgi:large subunit ribosomal protein L15